jgi:hypothetical protein
MAQMRATRSAMVPDVSGTPGVLLPGVLLAAREASASSSIAAPIMASRGSVVELMLES